MNVTLAVRRVEIVPHDDVWDEIKALEVSTPWYLRPILWFVPWKETTAPLDECPDAGMTDGCGNALMLYKRFRGKVYDICYYPTISYCG